MAIKTTKWDAANHLNSLEGIAAYIEAALEDGHPDLIAIALRNVARAKGLDRPAQDAVALLLTSDDDLAAGAAPRLSTLLGILRGLGLALSVKLIADECTYSTDDP